MSRTNPLHHPFGAWLVGLAAVAFWVVGVGAGWRGWLLVDADGSGRGIVAHAQGFGVEAYVWWIPASVLTLTAWVISLGVTIVRSLVDEPGTPPRARSTGPL